MSWDKPEDPQALAEYEEMERCIREQRLPKFNPYHIESVRVILWLAAMEISDIGEPPFTYEALLASYEKAMSPEGFDEETVKAALAGSEEISCENGLYQLV